MPPTTLDPNLLDLATRADSDETARGTRARGVYLSRLVELAAMGPAGVLAADQLMLASWTNRLRQFTPDPASFRNAMRSTQTVVSGSSALHLLDGDENYTPGDLDCYTSWTGFDPFCHFVVTQLGGRQLSPDFNDIYVDAFAETHDAAAPVTTGIVDRRRFRVNDNYIDVLRSRTENATFPLAFFHSTTVMNYFEADAFHVAYPLSILTRTGTITNRVLHHSARAAILKYQERGYQLHDTAREAWRDQAIHRCLPGGTCAGQTRTFGDRFSLSYTFDPISGVNTSTAANTVRWVWGGDGCGSVTCSGYVDPQVFDS